MRKLILSLICLLAAVPCHGEIYTVDSGGTGDFTRIQPAIDGAWHGDTIVVKPGTYNESVRFNGRAVVLTSKAPDTPSVVASTIIEGPSSSSVVFDFSEGNGSVLTGFTITGYGVYCYGASPTISKNIIRNCAGRGIMGGKNAAPIVSDNTISSNGQQGIYWCDGAITNNVITENNTGIAYCGGPVLNNVISDNFSEELGHGGGLYQCDGDIIGNVIKNNVAMYSGGGLYRCTGQIRDNVISGNISAYEGAGIWNCDGSISHNIIAGNSCNNGAGMHSCDGPKYLNTIIGNSAYTGGATRNCTGVFRNNIVAFNEAVEVGGVFGPCVSSYNCFWANIGGNFGGEATAGPGDFVLNPHFAVDGYWDPNGTAEPNDDFWVDGDYHLRSEAGRWDDWRQLWVEDDITSPCIDAGDPNSDWSAELWPHGGLINVGVYAGTPQASMSTSDVGNVADLNLDDLVDYNDLMLLTKSWAFSEVLLREDLNRNGVVDFADYAMMTANWLPKPPAPRSPVPDPMTWSVEPYATGPHSIAMVATTGTSTDGSGVEYYFEDAQSPAYNSGWLSFASGQLAIWQDTGLSPLSEYSYRVKARNKSNVIETDWSAVRSATTPTDDTTAPSPNPMTWESPPKEIKIGTGTFDYYATMTATEATDASGVVEYYFECTSSGLEGFSSGWQEEPTYTRKIGRQGQLARFRAKARDLYGNETGWSSEVAAVP